MVGKTQVGTETMTDFAYSVMPELDVTSHTSGDGCEIRETLVESLIESWGSWAASCVEKDWLPTTSPG